MTNFLKKNWPLLGLVGFLAAVLASNPPPPPEPESAPPVCPGPNCPLPTPKPRPKPWGPQSIEAVVSQDFVGPGGVEAACPLPKEFHLKNRGGSDGSGLCVFASITHSAQWQNIDVLKDLFQWMFKHPGGGWPEKVDDMIRKKCQEQNRPVPNYIQVEKLDLELLKLAAKTGKMPGITYARSPTGRYGGQRIAHMVSLVHASDNLYGILDNNYPGSVEWMNEAEFRSVDPSWAVIFLDPGPPSPPRAPVSSLENSMNFSRSLAPALVLGLLSTSLPSVKAGWGSGACGPVGPFAPATLSAQSPYAQSSPARSATYQWVPLQGSDKQIALYCNGVQLGNWVYAESAYYRLEAGKWLADKSPIGAPPGAEARTDKKIEEVAQNFGVDRSRCGRGGAYKLNGQDVDRNRIIQAIEGSIIDDSGFYQVTVIGPIGKKDQVVSDFQTNPSLAQWKDRVVVRSFTPDQWQVKDVGFVTNGNPTIYFQKADGTVLHRQDDYEGGAAALAEALRKADPNYKPEKDKDKRKDDDVVTSLLDKLKELPAIVWVLLIGGGLFWYSRRSSSTPNS